MKTKPQIQYRIENDLKEANLIIASHQANPTSTPYLQAIAVKEKMLGLLRFLVGETSFLNIENQF